MAKGKSVGNLINLGAWLTGILVSLAVGFGMAQRTLTIPWLNSIGAEIITIIAGWIVIILTIVSIVLVIVNKL